MSGPYAYRGYGLDIRSDLALPELLPGDISTSPDITIRLGEKGEPALRPLPPHDQVDYDFSPAMDGGQVLRVPEVGLYGVRAGRDILVLPEPNASIGYVRLFLTGSALGMALHQRGLLVIHGATVLGPEGTATIFVGRSGAGKSTLAAALARRGYAILGDDTMAVWPGAGGFQVWPGSRVFKLWQSSLDHMGEPAEVLERIANRSDKFFWQNRAIAPDRPIRVSELVHLTGGPPDSEPEFRSVGGIEALRLVSENTYRPGYVERLGRQADHFRQCAALVGSVRVGRLQRPGDLGRLDEGIRLLEGLWRTTASPVSANS